jgi:hypothetical protein
VIERYFVALTAIQPGLQGGRPAIRWLTSWRLLVIISVVLCGLFEARELYKYYATSDGQFDGTGQPIAPDYLNLWSAARLTLSGQVADLPDVTKFHQDEEALVGRPLRFLNWSYPPHLIPLILGIGLLPFFWGYALWSIVTFAGYAVSILAGRDRKLTPFLIALIAPSSYINFLMGQNGWLTAALLIGGLRLLDRYPVWSGVLFGILTIKPHLGLLVPVALVAAGAWRAIASAIFTAGAMVAGSIALLGVQPWIAYFKTTAPVQRHILEVGQGSFTGMMPTPFMAARQLGLGIGAGYALNALTALIAVALVFWCYRSRSLSGELRIAIFATAIFFVSPYAFTYDLTVVTAALIGLLAFRSSERLLPGELLAIVAMWTVPILSLSSLVNVAPIPYGPIILAATLAYLVAHAKRAPSASEALGTAG